METEDLDCVQSSGKAGEVFLKFSKKLLQNPLTIPSKSCIIYTVVDTAICESGGTGRRARLRGVWFTPYGFKSRFSHQQKTPSNARCFL